MTQIERMVKRTHRVMGENPYFAIFGCRAAPCGIDAAFISSGGEDLDTILREGMAHHQEFRRQVLRVALDYLKRYEIDQKIFIQELTKK